jgi:hypothetical protein
MISTGIDESEGGIGIEAIFEGEGVDNRSKGLESNCSTYSGGSQ